MPSHGVGNRFFTRRPVCSAAAQDAGCGVLAKGAQASLPPGSLLQGAELTVLQNKDTKKHI